MFGPAGDGAVGFLWAVALALLTHVACGRAVPAATLEVSLVPGPEGQDERVRVAGLSSAEVAALRQVDWTLSDWQALLKVSVEDTPEVAVAGRYEVAAGRLDFIPGFPFDRGRTYRVSFDPGRAPLARDTRPVITTLRLPADELPPEAMVTAVYPSADVWPANLLRFYIHFSQAMSRDNGVPFVQLLNADGKVVEDALLAAPVDFWSPDQRRYTVFFDPGRVKTDLVPNVELGRALVPGARYTLVISRDWPDAHRRPLREPYRKTFTVAAPIDRPLRLADWTVTEPAAGSRGPLLVSVPWALDQALFSRAVGVELGGTVIDGDVIVAEHERAWQFTPAEPWRSTEYHLVVLAELEDPSGNLIDQAFEVDPRAGSPGVPRPDRYRLAFTPR